MLKNVIEKNQFEKKPRKKLSKSTMINLLNMWHMSWCQDKFLENK